MEPLGNENILTLEVSETIWERVFTIAPLVIVGTREGDSYDLAPKHMVTPLGYGNYFGFVCTPRHSTYWNILETKEFTVSFPRPDQIVHTALSATPRSSCMDKADDVLQTLSLLKATTMEVPLIAGAYFYLECELFRIIDGFDDYSLITGIVKAAHVNRDYLNISEGDPREQLMKNPLLAYVAQGRFAKVAETFNFPFPKDFKK